MRKKTKKCFLKFARCESAQCGTLHCRAKANSSNCLLEKLAVTAVCICTWTQTRTAVTDHLKSEQLLPLRRTPELRHGGGDAIPGKAGAGCRASGAEGGQYPRPSCREVPSPTRTALYLPPG